MPAYTERNKRAWAFEKYYEYKLSQFQEQVRRYGGE